MNETSVNQSTRQLCENELGKILHIYMTKPKNLSKTG